MTREDRMIGDLVATARRGSNEAVRQNAIDLLHKLAQDGVRAAKRAIEAIGRTKLAEIQQRP